jgi:GTP cyclohydrolase I
VNEVEIDMLSTEILNMAGAISKKITQTKEYQDYQEALKYIKENPELMSKVKRLKKMHEDFSVHRNENSATFDEEKFISQEFYKLMLDKNVDAYFMCEHKIVGLISEVYSEVAKKCNLEIFIGE